MARGDVQGLTTEEIKDALVECANKSSKKQCAGCKYLDKGCEEQLISDMANEFRKMFGEEKGNDI